MDFKPFPKVENRRRVYLDHAAATPLEQAVFEIMTPFLKEEFGNPGGLYKKARNGKLAVDRARKTVSQALGANPRNIIFTGSGTESDNMAIYGVAKKQGSGHIITTKVEHHAVLHSCQALEKEGFEVTYLDTDEFGMVSPKDVIAALKDDTILISVMYANNEIGSINPIADIGRALLRWKKDNDIKPNKAPYLHTDACQAINYLDIDVKKLHADLLTFNGSKIYGPKGVGVLYKADHVKIKPLIHGGGQEMRMRAGTENVAGIVGLAKAVEIVRADAQSESERLTKLRDYFTQEIIKRIPKIVINGHVTERLPNNVNVSILDIEGEALLLYLDEYGIAMSTGSACTSESLDPSHVILAIGKPYEYAHGSMRFTLGRSTTKEDLDYVLNLLPEIVQRLRDISPVNLKLDDAGKPTEDNKKPTMQKAFVGEGKPHWMK